MKYTKAREITVHEDKVVYCCYGLKDMLEGKARVVLARTGSIPIRHGNCHAPKTAR